MGRIVARSTCRRSVRRDGLVWRPWPGVSFTPADARAARILRAGAIGAAVVGASAAAAAQSLAERRASAVQPDRRVVRSDARLLREVPHGLALDDHGPQRGRVLGLQAIDEAQDACAGMALQGPIHVSSQLERQAPERSIRRIQASRSIDEGVAQQFVEPGDGALAVSDRSSPLDAADERVLQNLFRELLRSEPPLQKREECRALGHELLQHLGRDESGSAHGKEHSAARRRSTEPRPSAEHGPCSGRGMPTWLMVISWVSVALGVASAWVVAADLLAGHAQKMWIMNIVWPVTALWSGPLGAWAYFRYGRADEKAAQKHQKSHGSAPPWPVLVGKAATHCGTGCTLGDIAAELIFLALPFTLFGHRLFGAWIYDFVAAFLLGIAFQYFTIKPMRHESGVEGLKDALKADTLSLSAWQVGMYGWMAVVTFAIFRHELRPTSIVFWFMMQLGMLAGFLTAYPVNWVLLRKGVKEPM